MFSGSYNPQDVNFLLKKIQMTSTDIDTKEKMIQKENSHYSQLLTFEKAPTKEYMDIFYATLQKNGQRFKNDLVRLANKISADYHKENEIVLVSLARAGTPVGVSIKRLLEKHRTVKHYSVSIVRDKGLDYNAIKYILSKHKDSSIAFIDGWTGKGVIGAELKESISAINKEHNTAISPNLYVIADISGTAYWSSTYNDYLLPSAILNSTISGLVSRTVLNKDYIGESDFHGCVYYDYLAQEDISLWFVDYLTNLENTNENFQEADNISRQEVVEKSLDTIEHFMKYYGFSNKNYIKPGIGESTRVLLRRKPKEIWLKNKYLPEVSHLLYLAEKKSVKILENPNLHYNSIAIIEEID